MKTSIQSLNVTRNKKKYKIITKPKIFTEKSFSRSKTVLCQSKKGFGERIRKNSASNSMEYTCENIKDEEKGLKATEGGVTFDNLSVPFPDQRRALASSLTYLNQLNLISTNFNSQIYIMFKNHNQDWNKFMICT